MHILNSVISFSFILITIYRTAEACNGYSIKVNYARNCITGSIISLLGDNGATLDKDCNLALSGCAEIMKSFKTHRVKYTIKKPPMPTMEGEVDACETLKNVKDPTMKEALTVFSVPSICPIKESKICNNLDNKLNISKFKNQLGMVAGTVDLKLEGTHDVGKTCVELSFTMSRGKRAG